MADPTNITSSYNQTCDLAVPSVSPVFMVAYSLVFLVGLFLNGIIVRFYCCRARQQTSSSLMVYLKNLTAADFLLCLCLPLRITKYATSSLTIRRLYCSFGTSAFFLNMQASILFMGYIAANRYLKVVHSSGPHLLQTVRAAYIISMITWVSVLAPIITYTILFFITQQPLTSDPGCCEVLISASIRPIYKVFQASSFILFLLVLISLVFFYYSTSRRVLQEQKKQLASRHSEKLVKSRRNILVLVSIFCVCFIPYYLVRLPLAFKLGGRSVRQVFYYLMDATTLLSVFNVCLDPLVYFFLCKSVRAQVNMKIPSKKTKSRQTNKGSEWSEEQQTVVTTAASQTSEL
ncbi:G-protein coupled receptor 87-like [Neolamprologus brichardi]|uniref:G-protein coupled receptor 87-like n=1 Tax=Neolamprologus brichardi TaxID=32507 RepID=UPI0003EC268E|nr:G-protein coupled receptor 87-like [Neolamprologus brichardi]